VRRNCPMRLARLWGGTRLLVIAATIGGAIAVAVSGHGDYAVWILGLGGAILWALPRTSPSTADAFDRAVLRQAIGIAAACVACFVLGVLAVIGVVRARNPGVVLVLGVLMVGIGTFIVLEALKFRRAGGGGLDAIAVWKRDGLDAVKRMNRGEDQSEVQD
jgi:hypothetical protein